MGHPHYDIIDGEIMLDGQSLNDMEPDERAQLGVFLAFQSIPEVKGVKLFAFLRTIYAAKEGEEISFVQFKRIIVPLMEELDIDTEFLRRDLNVWFSGGERRKIEILQLRLLQPRYIFLDEVDSGLDVDAFRSVAALIKETNTAENTFIVITHYFTILDHVPLDEVIVLKDGEVVEKGRSDIAERIRENGFGG